MIYVGLNAAAFNYVLKQRRLKNDRGRKSRQKLDLLNFLLHYVPKKRLPFYFSNNSVKN